MSTNNLSNKEAQIKIKELAEAIDFAMMATDLTHKPLHLIPMSTKKVDKQGAIWFLSSSESEHNHDLTQDSDVQLIYSQPNNMKFMIIYGKAGIHKDKAILKELYGSTDDSWFDGVDDPKLTAIEVVPSQAHYWEPKNNKFVSLLKMGMGALTGDEPDISKHGDIKV